MTIIMDGYCLECKREFVQIKLHRDLVHLKKKEKFCELCGLLFSKSSRYLRHSDKHKLEDGGKIIKCHLCLKPFKDSNRLSIHLEKHSCLHIFKCSNCTKTFALHRNYTHHTIYVHADTIPSSENNEDGSNITDDAISTVTDDFAMKPAKNVVDISTGTVDSDRGSSYCSICDFNFAQLKLHNAIFHCKKSQLICEICGKIFCSVRKHSKHFSSHVELSINCHVCMKRDFHNSSVFLKHLEKHYDLHVFYCSYCSKSFTLEISLMKHIRRKHGDKYSPLDISLNGSPTLQNSRVENSDISSENVKDNESAKLQLNLRGENCENDSIIGDTSMNRTDDGEKIVKKSPMKNDERSKLMLRAQISENDSIVGDTSMNHTEDKTRDNDGKKIVTKSPTKEDKRSEFNLKAKNSENDSSIGDTSMDHTEKIGNHDGKIIVNKSLKKERTRLELNLRAKNDENGCDIGDSSMKSSTLTEVQQESLTYCSISDETMDDYPNGSSKRKRSSLEGINLHKSCKKSKKNSCEVETKDNSSFNEDKPSDMDSSLLNSIWKSGFLKSYNETLIDDEELSVFSDRAIDSTVDTTCFVCGDICEIDFKHFITEHNGGRFDCSTCGKIFDRPVKLYHHAMMHAKKYPWKCKECSAKFVELKLFRRHVEVVHYIKNRFKCADCDQFFTSQSTYDGHFRMHHDQWKFKCNFCPKVYIYKRFLIAHMVSSDCELCGVSFPCRTHYYDHFDSVHKKEAMFDCPHCTHVATSEAKLKSHKTTKHFDLTVTDINYCKFCPKVCNSKHNLRRHIKNHHKVT